MVKTSTIMIIIYQIDRDCIFQRKGNKVCVLGCFGKFKIFSKLFSFWREHSEQKKKENATSPFWKDVETE